MDIIQKKEGYFQCANKPSQDELSAYYAKKYFQNPKSTSYQLSYSEDEKKYISSEYAQRQWCLEKKLHIRSKGKTFLDIGCGEGWALSHFSEIGCKVKGVDFSSYGVKKFNPKVQKYFIKSDIFHFIDQDIRKKNKYDIIHVKNVIEHVLEPEMLLTKIRALLKDNGIVMMTFPNDFSPIQKKLLKLNKINDYFWVTPPDHISYFNNGSFDALARRLGYRPLLTLADFPIDIFLFNDWSNYVHLRNRGKEAHQSKVHFMTLLFELDPKKCTEILLKWGEMGVGRALTFFMRLKAK